MSNDYESMNNSKGIRDYIEMMYPALSPRKFDIVKSGTGTLIFLVDRRGELQRAILFKGNLSSVDTLPALKRQLESNIRDAMVKWNYT
jgi:hypothetical protein